MISVLFALIAHGRDILANVSQTQKVAWENQNAYSHHRPVRGSAHMPPLCSGSLCMPMKVSKFWSYELAATLFQRIPMKWGIFWFLVFLLSFSLIVKAQVHCGKPIKCRNVECSWKNSFVTLAPEATALTFWYIYSQVFLSKSYFLYAIMYSPFFLLQTVSTSHHLSASF